MEVLHIKSNDSQISTLLRASFGVCASSKMRNWNVTVDAVTTRASVFV